VLAGGILSGKYLRGEGGRMDDELDDPRVAGAVALAGRLSALAQERGVAPATLAMAFALHSPGVATVLFGATRPEQVAENLRALELGSDVLAQLRSL
jgi:aryl-alcohol dehydrogenase-like predicted oxidoreductase